MPIRSKPQQPPDIVEGTEVILRGRVTLVRHDGDKLVYVVTIHDALVDGRVQVSAEGVEKA